MLWMVGWKGSGRVEWRGRKVEGEGGRWSMRVVDIAVGGAELEFVLSF